MLSPLNVLIGDAGPNALTGGDGADLLLGDGAEQRVVSADAEGLGSEAFSYGATFAPDGQQILFLQSLGAETAGQSDPDVIMNFGPLTGASQLQSTNPGALSRASDAHFSPDASHIVFASTSAALLPDDQNGSVSDIFILDLSTKAVSVVSSSGDATQANAASYDPVFSPDGRSVAFDSFADNLVAGDTNGVSDVFLKDLQTGSVTRISVNQAGEQGHSDAFRPVFAPAGDKVAFLGGSIDLVGGTDAGQSAIFIKQLSTGALSAPVQVGPDSSIFSLSFSNDGSKILFVSDSDALVKDDTNGAADAFALDLGSGAITRLSLTATGMQAADSTYQALFTPDGSAVVLRSDADLAGDGFGGGVFVRHLADGGVVRLSSNAAGFDTTIDAVSPDGRSVLVETSDPHLTGRDYSNGDIVSLDLAGPHGGADTLVGGAGDDVLVGGMGDDQLEGDQGRNVLLGGDGRDTAVYSGFLHDFDVSMTAGDGAVASDLNGMDDRLSSIETVSFLDGKLSFDLQGVAAQIVRLYDSFLGRAPDLAGFDAYLDFVAAGHSLADMAANAAASPEFKDATARLSDADYITYVYAHSLRRAPDPQGMANYLDALRTGALTRTSMILQAAESPEHVALTADAVGAGLWLPDHIAQGLELLYDAAVQRQPDAFGLAEYKKEIAGGLTFKAIANQMAESAEFKAVHAGQTDAQFVDSLYVSTVHRHADNFGLESYVAELSQGYSRGDVLYQMSMSEEHQSHVLTYFDPSLVS